MTNKMKRQLTSGELAQINKNVEEYKDNKEIQKQEKKNEYLGKALKGKEWIEFLPYRFVMTVEMFKQIKLEKESV